MVVTVAAVSVVVFYAWWLFSGLYRNLLTKLYNQIVSHISSFIFSTSSLAGARIALISSSDMEYKQL